MQFFPYSRELRVDVLVRDSEERQHLGDFLWLNPPLSLENLRHFVVVDPHSLSQFSLLTSASREALVEPICVNNIHAAIMACSGLR